jgi:hypothetical protein
VRAPAVPPSTRKSASTNEVKNSGRYSTWRSSLRGSYAGSPVVSA